MKESVKLKTLHPNNTKGNGEELGHKIKETAGYTWYKFDHNGQVIRVKRF